MLAVRKPLVPYHPNAQLGSSCEHPFLHSSERVVCIEFVPGTGQVMKMHHQEHPAFFHETDSSFDSDAVTTFFMVGLACHSVELLR